MSISAHPNPKYTYRLPIAIRRGVIFDLFFNMYKEHLHEHIDRCQTLKLDWSHDDDTSQNQLLLDAQQFMLNLCYKDDDDLNAKMLVNDFNDRV